MNKETLDLIQALANKLGTTVDHIWSILVKQAYVEAVTSVFISFILIIATVILWKLWYNVNRKNETEDGNEDGWLFILTVAAILGSLASIVSLVITIYNVGVACINPEYFAFNQIKEFLSK